MWKFLGSNSQDSGILRESEGYRGGRGGEEIVTHFGGKIAPKARKFSDVEILEQFSLHCGNYRAIFTPLWTMFDEKSLWKFFGCRKKNYTPMFPKWNIMAE